MGAARRSAEERRDQILEASLDLFARQGLHGVTTRMIAEAAGMSEALLYRHFRSKEELYQELQRSCLRGTMGAAEKLAQLPLDTSTLVLAVYFTVHQIIGPGEGLTGPGTCVKRIMLTSLIGDGTFARGLCQVNFARFLPRLAALLEAARKAGDIDGPRPSHPQLGFWFMHHTAVMAANMYLPDPPVVDHGICREALVDEIVRFALRGLGLSAAAIARHVQPKLLAAATHRLLQESAAGAGVAATPARKETRR